MYLHNSTPELVRRERLSLNRQQWRKMTVGSDPQTGLPVYDKDKLPELLCHCGVPIKLSEWKMDDFTGKTFTAAREAIDKIWGEFEFGRGSSGMCLAGVPTTGKTSFSCAVLRSAAWRGCSIKFISWDDFHKFHTTWIELSQRGDEYDDYAERADEWRAELWRMYRVYEVLVIDDVARTKAPTFIYEEFHSMLRSRLASGTYTIVTLNIPVIELNEKVDPSVAEFIRREYDVFGLPAKETVNAR